MKPWIEARHDGVYRRIEVITGRRQRRNWTDEDRRGSLMKAQNPRLNISAVARRWGVNRGLLNVWRRQAGLTSDPCKPCAQQAMFVAGDRRWEDERSQSASSDIASVASGRIEIEIAGARMTVIGSVAL